MNQQQRKEDIHQWLQSFFGQDEFSLTKLKGDASFRHYFRLKVDADNPIQNKNYIVMDSPPNKEPLAPFLNTTNILRNAQLPAPKIYHQHQDKGFLLLEDFGDNDCLSVLTSENADHYYQQAINLIITLQRISPRNDLPCFDENQITRELDLFSEWFLTVHQKTSPTPLASTFAFLMKFITEQKYVVTHRDFHSRNLMVKTDDSIGILDHQDLMLGPTCYDLVSLLKDCYIDWPEQRVIGWVKYYLQKASSTESFNTFWHQFEITGLQRHLKALGIFARQAHLYNNPNYLQYIPRVLKYIHDVADKHDNLTALARLIKTIS